MDPKKRIIRADPEKCSGCLHCQIQCSFAYTEAFNPAAARIQVLRGARTREISFSPECNLCGICVNHCVYGGITMEGGEG